MASETSLNHESPAQAGAYTTGVVTSQDGATIGYRQFGHGPGVVLLHGAASSGYNHVQLAQALADTFTVYVPDRRGRGLSSPYSADDPLQQEIEDLEALLTATGAHQVFGVSLGAIICLQAMLTLPAIQRAAIYEPPFFPDQQTPRAVLTRFDQEMAQGKIAAAMITGMKGAKMGPPLLNAMPRWLLAPLVNMAMNGEEKKGTSGYVSMRALASTMHYDFQPVVEMSGSLERFRDVRAEVLLLGGSKSPAYLKAALGMLEPLLPHATRLELPGLNHAASWNRDRGGNPAPVAQALRHFFAEPRYN